MKEIATMFAAAIAIIVAFGVLAAIDDRTISLEDRLFDAVARVFRRVLRKIFK